MKNDLTFLNYNQIIGDNKLNIFKKYGSQCEITDFAILLGGESVKKDDKNIGAWWTKTPYYTNEIFVINEEGSKKHVKPYSRNYSTRPVTSYSSIENNSKIILKDNKILEIEYCELPQMVVDLDYSYELESNFNMNLLLQTGKVYTVDFNVDKNSFIPRSYTEYLYNGEKYIRFIAGLNNLNSELSDGRKVLYQGIYWLKVEPIIWIVDLTSDIAITKKSIISGLQYNCTKYIHKHFERNDIKKYMDNYLSNEIQESKKRILIKR